MIGATLKIALITLPIVIRMDRTWRRSIGENVLDEIMELPVSLFTLPEFDGGGIDTGRIYNYCCYTYGLESRPEWLDEGS